MVGVGIYWHSVMWLGVVLAVVALDSIFAWLWKGR